MLKCREVTAQASQWLEGGLSFRERLALRVHLMMCRRCRNFVDALAETVNLIHRSDLARHYSLISETALQSIERALAVKLADVHSSAHQLYQPAVKASNDARIVGVTDPDDERVQRVFAEIEATEGFVPNLFRAYAHHPEMLEHNWQREKALMYHGVLGELIKNAIAVVVSHDNRCHYCVHHHTRALHEAGMEEAQIQALKEDPWSAPFSDKERALLVLTRQANLDARQVSRQMMQSVWDAGTTDEELVEAMAVMELYSSFNRFLETLRIPLEEINSH